MKKILLTLFGAFLCVSLFAQGVSFQDLSLEDALAKAKSENKMVFVDCYTTWCGPCKMMTNEIFPQEKCGNFFNPKFVCVKFDMEKPAGKAIGDRYGVPAYPTFLMLNSDGALQGKLVGGGDADGFIERVTKSIDPKNNIELLSQKYKSGKMSKLEMIRYCEVLEGAYDKEGMNAVKAELQSKLTNADKLKPEFWSYIKSEGDLEFVKANLAKLRKNIGTEEVDNFLSDSYESQLYTALSKRSRMALPSSENMRSDITSLGLKNQEGLLALCDIYKAVENNNMDDVTSALLKAQPSLPSTPAKLNALGSLSSVCASAGKSNENYDKLMTFFGEYSKGFSSEKEVDNVELYAKYIGRMVYPGTWFDEITFENALKTANTYKRPLFIDCYTTWCGPCKYMTTTIFPMEKVGEYMNSHFLNVKYDMETEEGKAIAAKFGVRAYPTFLILNPDGTLLHRIVGGGDADAFLAAVKDSEDENKAVGLLAKKYNEGNRDKKFLANYALVSKSSYDMETYTKICPELAKSLTDEEKVSEEYSFLFNGVEYGSEMYNILLSNRTLLSNAKGKNYTDSLIEQSINAKIMYNIIGRDTKALDAAGYDALKAEVKSLKLVDSKKLGFACDLGKTMLSGDKDKILKVASSLPKYNAYEYYLNCSQKVMTDATADQKKAWITIGENISAGIKDATLKPKFDRCIEQIRAM